LEDARASIAHNSGLGEAECTLFREEGRPKIQAHDEFRVKSTKNGNERLITVCIRHGDEPEQGKLPYTIARGKRGINWKPF